MKKIFFFLLFSCLSLSIFAQNEITILFTHDLHSAFLGTNHQGGYARLFSVIENERSLHPASTLLLDAGDIAMGSFFHTLFMTESSELRLMGKMGYDVTTFGNHDFDFGIKALANALKIARNYTPTPLIVAANLRLKDQSRRAAAQRQYGIKEYIIVEKEGKRIGIFGLLGSEAFDNAPNAAVLHYEEPVDCAKRIVKILREQEKADIIICLSHSGSSTNKKYSEDEILARKAAGIDIIISGHSHTVLPEPIIVGNTIIASAGSRGKYLGSITLNVEQKSPKLIDYKLIAITNLFPENDSIKKAIEYFKEKVEEQYLQPLGLHFDDTVAHSCFELSAQANIAGESELGALIADAYLQAALRNGKTAHIGVVTSGGIRDNLYTGYVTEDQIFNILSLGVGPDGKAGYPLVLLHLTGKELWDLCELDASISPMLTYAQLFFSGLRYEYNPHRLFCNRVTRVEVKDETGNFVKPDPEKLYAVVASLYSAQMLEVVKAKTHGILSLTPKTAEGIPTDDYEAAILKDNSGNEIKEWLAFENYLRVLKEIPPCYIKTENRKLREDECSLKAVLMLPNRFAWFVYGATVLLLAGVSLLTIFILRRIQKRREEKEDR